MASQDPANRVLDDAQKLERVIVIQPPETIINAVSMISYWKKHGTLEGYDIKKIEGIVQRERQIVSDFSNVFKRIVLFELAAYIGGTYATDFPDESSTKEVVANLNRAGISLMHDQDYSQAHQVIAQASKGLKGKKFLTVMGRAQSSYLTEVDQVLRMCAPEKVLPGMNVGFAGRNIKFAIDEWGEYSQEMKRDPDFGEFAKNYKSIFKPVSGYLLFRSPEIVSYANDLLNEFANKHHTLDLSEITFRGRAPLDFFRLVYNGV